MADKFEDLRTYVAVVSNGGINAAAVDLGIAKSAVSRRISDLEERLGVTLVERTTRKFELTAVGRAYFDRACTLLAALEQLDADPTGTSERVSVTISASHEILSNVVGPALRTFMKNHPEVTVRLLPDGEAASVAIGLAGSGLPSAHPMLRARRVLCASERYLAERGWPTVLSDIAGHIGIEVDGLSDGWTFANGGQRRPGTLVSVPDADVAASLVQGSVGIAQLPGYIFDALPPEAGVVSLLEADEPPPMDIVVSVAADAPAAAAALADHLIRNSRTSAE